MRRRVSDMPYMQDITDVYARYISDMQDITISYMRRRVSDLSLHSQLVLNEFEVDQKLLAVTRTTLMDTKSKVKCLGCVSDFFEVTTGVR